MAKPIEATPILRGKDALRFVKQIKANERMKTPAKIDLEIAQLIKANELIFNNIKTTL